ncbi:MAG: hypothetical protein IJ677_08300 [Alphaproteobacteria bacterium]|nr:hypothetical protein [Alphaproteobacteria bacterium]
MKFLTITVSFLVLVSSLANAAERISYTEEMYALGTVCGQGLACKSPKYHQFELLARALVVSKAANDQMQQEGMQSYNAGKVDAFMGMEASNFADCDMVREEFDKQKIFQSVLYSDGRIKLYDGTMITPRRPYEASKLYTKDREAFIKADAAYKKSVALAKKNAQNAKQVPLYDARYESIAKQF